MSLDNRDLGIIIGVSVSVAFLITVMIVLCCLSRKKGKKEQTGEDAETSRSKGRITHKDKPDVASTEGFSNLGADTEEAVRESKVTYVKGKETINKDDEIEVLYAKVAKTKPSQDYTVNSKDQSDKPPVTDEKHEVVQNDVARNSPDGSSAAERSETVSSVADEAKKATKRFAHSDTVLTEKDVNKLPSDEHYMKVHHQISFSSEDDDRSSIASRPSTKVDESKKHGHFLSNVQTTARTTKSPKDSYRQENGFEYVSNANAKRHVILPDDTGLARVYVTPGVRHEVRAPQPISQPIDVVVINNGAQIGLSSENLRGIPEDGIVSSQNFQQSNNSVYSFSGQREFSKYRQVPVHERYRHRHRLDMRDNVSYTEGRHTIGEYAVPGASHRYASVSSAGSINRDRSYSLDDSYYYTPSRRSSIGSGYSIVASTYFPGKHVKKRYITGGRYKLHKPLSMFDLHQMKYRSYKGSLPPYDIPL